MSPAAALSEDQRDALQELTNIAMGQAGASLATLLDEFVDLSIPRIRVVEVKDFSSALGELVGDTDVSAVRQSFQGYLRGEALVIFTEPGCRALADLMGYDDIAGQDDTELLLDVANILSGACLGGMIEQIRKFTGGPGTLELSFSMPSVMAREVPPTKLIDPKQATWTHSLFLEVNFTLKSRNFVAHLVTLMPEDGIAKIRDIVDEFIASF